MSMIIEANKELQALNEITPFSDDDYDRIGMIIDNNAGEHEHMNVTEFVDLCINLHKAAIAEKAAKLAAIKERYYLNETGTGGNCTAWSTDLSVKQDTIYITGSDCCAPDSSDDSFTVSVFLNGEHGEPAHMFTTSDVDHLDELIQSCFNLWGN